MRLIDADALEQKLSTMTIDFVNYKINLEAVYSAIRYAPTVGDWISVKDRLPENQNPVIVFVPHHVDEVKGTFLGYVGMAYYTRLGEGFWCGTDGNLYGAIGMIYPPTHWMPLPEPPKEVSGDE
jgi:hypothetical protein